jgi:hypothetical protein
MRRYQYTVTESNSGSDQKYLTVGRTTSEEIVSYISEGHTMLKIHRFRSGKDAKPHNILPRKTKPLPLIFVANTLH